MKKMLFDFFPIILFFAAFKAYADPRKGILVATGVVIVATALQVGWTWWRTRRVEKLHVVTLALVVVLGGATLAFDNAIFIKWKPTVVNWLFGLVFLASEFVGKRSIVRRMMEGQISLPARVWTRLNLSWVAFFIASGLLNLYVVYHFDTATWVNFKLFGMMGLTIVFVIAQGVYMMRHVEPAEDAGDAS